MRTNLEDRGRVPEDVHVAGVGHELNAHTPGIALLLELHKTVLCRLLMGMGGGLCVREGDGQMGGEGDERDGAAKCGASAEAQ